jgi:mannose-1-phosphate guanylyltransferase/mannose-6-phosphate isomerase
MVVMHIQPIILAGGSGTRLWPASRQNYPKQLLTLTGAHSLLQETALRLRGVPSAFVASDPMVVTNDEYRFLVADQLRELGIEEPRVVLEPMGRNTAPALTLAALLLDHGGLDPLMLVMPADHLIADLPAFRAAVEESALLAEAGMIVTFGIVPDRPETGYGYIRMGGPVEGAATARQLAEFREKPDAATAELLIADHEHLWNSGIFMVKRSVWLSAIESCRPDIAAACRAALAGIPTDGVFVRVDRDAFSSCPSDSIDYAVLERLDAVEGARAAVVPLNVGWSDVGAWDALWAVSEKDACDNVTRGDVVLEDTRGSLVFSDSRLVAVIGCDDLVVVETADATLVARKDRTGDIKKLVAKVQEKNSDLTLNHRQVHRPWGRFESLDSGEHFQVKHIVVKPGAGLSLQLHEHRAEHWVVVSGIADVTCGEEVFRLVQNESTYIPLGTPHRLENPGPEPLDIIEVQSGDYLGEDDIIRLEDRYGRA